MCRTTGHVTQASASAGFVRYTWASAYRPQPGCSWQTSLDLGSISQYSTQILFCIENRGILMLILIRMQLRMFRLGNVSYQALLAYFWRPKAKPKEEGRIPCIYTYNVFDDARSYVISWEACVKAYVYWKSVKCNACVLRHWEHEFIIFPSVDLNHDHFITFIFIFFCSYCHNLWLLI